MFPTQCDSQLLPVDFTQTLDLTRLTKTNDAPPLDLDAFIVGPHLDVSGEQETILLVTGYAEVDDCVGTLNLTTCNPRAGIGEYSVTIDRDEVKVDTPVHPKFVQFGKSSLVIIPSMSVIPHSYHMLTTTKRTTLE